MCIDVRRRNRLFFLLFSAGSCLQREVKFRGTNKCAEGERQLDIYDGRVLSGRFSRRLVEYVCMYLGFLASASCPSAIRNKPPDSLIISKRFEKKERNVKIVKSRGGRERERERKKMENDEKRGIWRGSRKGHKLSRRLSRSTSGRIVLLSLPDRICNAAHNISTAWRRRFFTSRSTDPLGSGVENCANSRQKKTSHPPGTL